ncbi:MAG: NTP transferase domain-containing protein [Oscillospiraceae bacterium]|nr:NTP transferase domain-containing protein [Oscillospiraceae bacterium]
MDNLKVLILAAGKGTRLETEGISLPKVMRLALGRPLIGYVLDELGFLDKKDIVIVVGYRREHVISAFPGYNYAIQEEQLGTGHAVMCAADYLKDYDGNVLICYGDMPLLSRETYTALAETHMREGNDCTVLTGIVEEDLPYGRIIRDENGGFVEVVEDRDCTPEQKLIRELNIGVYVYKTSELLDSLSHLNTDNAQHEYYLTDVPAIIRAKGGKIGICKRSLGHEILGVNTVAQLRQAEEYLSERL